MRSKPNSKSRGELRSPITISVTHQVPIGCQEEAGEQGAGSRGETRKPLRWITMLLCKI
ncbi:hypothetical protein [Calothrix rhizosoleniae]|uniref:hypothetical protein n=1 Tax=Calothrix rhizosoleniae TaxID=888997 RepID=UPI0013562C24|nr:hypothetical protein [Calothrix rhizosoleniae]